MNKKQFLYKPGDVILYDCVIYGKEKYGIVSKCFYTYIRASEYPTYKIIPCGEPNKTTIVWQRNIIKRIF